MYKHWILLATGIVIVSVVSYLAPTTKQQQLSNINEITQQESNTPKSNANLSSRANATLNMVPKFAAKTLEMDLDSYNSIDLDDAASDLASLPITEIGVTTSISEVDVDTGREHTEWQNPIQQTSQQILIVSNELYRAELERQRLLIEQQIAIEPKNVD